MNFIQIILIFFSNNLFRFYIYANDFEVQKVCYGTNLGLSPHSYSLYQQYKQNFHLRYINCTYVEGNLELIHLDNNIMEKIIFLEHIKEITGYLLIYNVISTVKVILPRLQIIRGRTLLKVDDNYFSFYLGSCSESPELPALRDILYGSAYIKLESNPFCHIKTIDWNEILSEKNSTIIYDYSSPINSSIVNCTKCDSSCEGGCWGSDSKNCQKFNKIYCSTKCNGKRCFGTGDSQCCHRFCVGGCTGPTLRDCYSCLSFYDNPICKYKCHSLNDTIEDGFNSCVDETIEQNELCPENYYLDWASQEQELNKPLQKFNGCHTKCEMCSRYASNGVCLECSYIYNGTEQICIPCHFECLGCTGSGNHQCIDCRNFKILTYSEEFEISTGFNCTSKCNREFPYTVYSNNEKVPICSKLSSTSWSREDYDDLLKYVRASIFTIIIITFVWYIVRTYKKQVKAEKLLDIEDSLPMNFSNIGPNLTNLRVINESELKRKKLLGMGAFGKVYNGIWFPENQNLKIPIAVKILIDNKDLESCNEFLEEAYVMASVDHPNLLKLLAVCMVNEMMLITQLMPLGCLLNYIKKHNKHISSKVFLNWFCQIAEGMAYLEEKHFVHRDLAARNILLRTPFQIKITDFGLAKLLDCNSQYKSTGGKLPIKWLAPECIKHRTFTSKSDVWAFGVTTWEILTYGESPYANNDIMNLYILITNGLKLPQPKICTLDIYMILLSCWTIDPCSRPTFKQLYEKFSNMSTDPGRYLVIDGDKYLRLPSFIKQKDNDLIQELDQNSNESCLSMNTEHYMQLNSISLDTYYKLGTNLKKSDNNISDHIYENSLLEETDTGISVNSSDGYKTNESQLNYVSISIGFESD